MKKILIGLLVVVAVLSIVISRQPADFKVTRSATISAPAAKIFPHVNNIKAWEAWSPWAKMDPNAKMTYEGPASGVGASQSWEGNSKVGAGKMTVTESKPNEMVQFRLDFLKPFKATNTAEFTFQSQGKETLVSWSMSGKNNFVSKAMSLVMNCDKMIGGEFEKGLASLKAVSEAPAGKS